MTVGLSSARLGSPWSSRRFHLMLSVIHFLSPEVASHMSSEGVSPGSGFLVLSQADTGPPPVLRHEHPVVTATGVPRHPLVSPGDRLTLGENHCSRGLQRLHSCPSRPPLQQRPVPGTSWAVLGSAVSQAWWWPRTRAVPSPRPVLLRGGWGLVSSS